MAALTGPFNMGWYYQPVLKGRALAPVARTGTKGPLVPEGQHRFENRGNRPFPTGANARTCGSASTASSHECVAGEHEMKALFTSRKFLVLAL